MNQLINQSFECVKHMSAKWKIDESHALKHSIEVYTFASNIYDSEVKNNSYLKEQQHIIYSSAILHDMCDKKYMKEQEPIDKEQIDDLETIKEELRLYGDEAVSDSDAGWDLGREETL